jgi:hypothetical protein
MKRSPAVWWRAGLLLGTAGWAFVAGPPARAADEATIQGTCTFGNKKSTWSATLSPKGDGTYDAIYVSSWGGQPLSYIGTVKTDGKTEIRGDGKANGGRANGTFEFAGKYGPDGIAQCAYEEVGGRGRKGTLTAETLRAGGSQPPSGAQPNPAPAD